MSDLSRDQESILTVLDRIKEGVKEDSEDAACWAKSLGCMLDNLQEEDFFGSEASTDHRGDFRNGEFTMLRIEQSKEAFSPSCSEERPCINCYSDNGECLDGPGIIKKRDAELVAKILDMGAESLAPEEYMGLERILSMLCVTRSIKTKSIAIFKKLT